MSTTGHETEAINVQGLKASLKKGGNKGIYNEAICSTAGATAAKVTNTTPPSFSLVSGAKIIVKFTYTISVANATLQVGANDTAKPIYFQGAPLAANIIKAGTSVLLSYDGTSFNIIGGLGTQFTAGDGIDITSGSISVKAGTNLSFDANGNLNATDTTYSTMGASGSTHAGGLVPDTPSTAGTSKYLREDGTWAEPTSGSSTDVAYDTTNKKITETIAGTTTDVVTAATLVKDGNAMTLDNYTDISDWGTSASHYDLDNLTTPGQYVMADSEKLDYFDNKAYNSTFFVDVVKPNADTIVQTFSRISISFSYRRQKIGDSAWDSWYLIATDLNLNFERVANYTSLDELATSESHLDLNSLITCGTYGSTSNNTAGYIDNKPSTDTSRTIRLVVFKPSRGANYFAQRWQYSISAYGTGTDVYERYTADSGSTWTDWVLVQQDMNGVLQPTVFAPKVGQQSAGSGALTIDASTRTIYRQTLNGNVSGITINNMILGQLLICCFKSSTSTTRTIALSSSLYYTPTGSDYSITVPKSGEGYTLIGFIMPQNGDIYVFKLN